MFALTKTPEMGVSLCRDVLSMSTAPRRGTDAMAVIQYFAGILVETYFLFDDPDVALETSFQMLSDLLGCEPLEGPLGPASLPPAHTIDFETENGRAQARFFFEDWLSCEFELHSLILSLVHNMFVSWEAYGQSRAESFRLLVECTVKCMGFEIAAQELCDIVIEQKALQGSWALADCISALSAVAGSRVALLLEQQDCLDSVMHVMTQEAIRLGVPAGSDWRFGLAANDVPANAPVDLVFQIEPYCTGFFEAMNISDPYDQSVACAKAAGRMLAVAAGGQCPDLEPVIAKPLAIAAMTETYRSVSMMRQTISL